jgi:hypothetical protein
MITKVETHWSDRQPFLLEIGQYWEDRTNPEDIKETPIIILGFSDDKAKVTYIYDQAGDKPVTDMIFGVDGFIDLLETCCYELAL